MSYFQHSEDLPTWVGQRAPGWTTDWLKWHVRLSTQRPTDEEVDTLPYIANEDIASWTGKLLNPNPQPADADSRKFQPDDVLFNKLRPYLAKVYHAPTAGVSSGELLCLRGSERIVPRYLFYVMSSTAFVEAVNAETFGSKMPRADWEIVGHQPLPLPKMDTQRRIVTFLDEKTMQIDALIERKRTLLKKLGEKRQAVITRAVTQGLNPAAVMKGSDIDWLGQIPTHWEAKRLSFVSQVIDCKHRTPEYIDEGVPLVSTTEISPYQIDYQTKRQVSKEELAIMSEGGRQPRIGDIIYSRNASVGSAALVRDDRTLCLGQDLCLIRLSTILPSFLEHFLNSTACLMQLESHLVGATFKRVNVDVIKKYLFPLPPKDEQVEISAFLHRVNKKSEAAERAISDSVASLAAYRSALITAAVTGRIEGLR